ncbi:MAG: WD40-like repeat-like protein, partial [Verrucomicrobiales bacterium]|nr:WD40-like repeat-like protein [Verrucomicrobiales bacterium]
VIAMFGTGDLVAYSVGGKELWALNLARKYGRFSIMWLYGSTPLLMDNKLYVQVMDNNYPSGYPHAVDDKPTRQSYILCLDAETGKEIWRHIRQTDAIVEAQESYSSPVPLKVGNDLQLVVIGGDYATGHDFKDGRELWRQGGLNERHEKFWRLVPSPTPGDGVIFVAAPRKDPVLAIKPGSGGSGAELLWKFKEFPSDCPTPLYYQHQLFVLDGDKYMMTCLDPKTGEKKWQGEMGIREIFRSSPTGADGKIYCVSEKGTVVVLEAGPEFKILATIKHNDEPVRGSIAVANGHLFIRGGKNLWCIGPK